jgi:hypothetical protein
LTKFHGAEFQEHTTYVIGRAITSERRVPPGTAVRAVLITRKARGRSAAPLDGRVLLNADEEPFEVTVAGATAEQADE